MPEVSGLYACLTLHGMIDLATIGPVFFSLLLDLF